MLRPSHVVPDDMRVISGSAGGLVLKSPRGHKIRPTTDRVKEAVFNILTSRFSLAGESVLDLFAGTGALGIEALSRGARTAMFVDQRPEAERLIRANLQLTRLRSRGRILRTSALTALTIAEGQRLRFGGVFLDPPYDAGWVAKVLQRLAHSEVLTPGGWVVAEYAPTERGADEYGSLLLTDRRRYGTTWVSLYQQRGEEAV